MTERRILESWKEIAAYLGRTGKTCRNWEKEYGLPVHRLDSSARAHVFAYADEIDRWKAEKLKAAEAGTIGRFFSLSKLPRPARLGLIAVSALAFLAALGLILKEVTRSGSSSGGTGVKSIAVLPFVDLSPDKGQEHLGDGIADILINALSRIEGLRIPARTSAFYFKGKDARPEEIGRKLKVEWILEGSVQVYENRLRVVANLLRAADGTTIWADRYDRNPYDIFAVEDDLARMVVDNLKIKITGDKNAPLVKPGTANPKTYKLYLQGRYLWNKRGSDNLMNAIDYFHKAIELDTRFGPGYAGLSMAYAILGDNAFLAARVAFPKAEAYALKAIEIDDGLAEAHASLGDVKLSYEWDFAGAEREFKKATELNPGDVWANQGYAFLLTFLGKHDEAIREIKRAREIDPLALRIRANVGNILYLARRYSEAELDLKAELEFEPDNCAVYNYLMCVFCETGRYQQALEAAANYYECEHSPPAGGRSRYLDVYIAGIWARLGKPEEARKILSEIEHSIAEGVYISPAFLAAAYGWLGEKEVAFSLLEKAYKERDRSMAFLKVDPWYDPLRSDSRFADLLRRIGLEN